MPTTFEGVFTFTCVKVDRVCSGVIGSGLAVFSRHPIIEVSCRRFSVNGKPQRIFHGDYLGGKAIGLCRIRHPAGTVDFYNTHVGFFCHLN